MMAKTKTFKQFSDEQEYTFSSTQINLPDEVSQKILDWGDSNITDSDLYIDQDDPTFGREDEPHITILYGLHTIDPKPVEQLLQGEKSFEITLGKMSLFTTNDKFDVLKIEVTGKKLHNLHKLFATNLKNTETYPKYIPHVTIAYVKKGKADSFIGNAFFAGNKITVKSVVFSSKNGKKKEIEI